MIKVELNDQIGVQVTDNLFQELAEKISNSEKMFSTQNVALMLIDSVEMKRLNKTWRGRNSATDVLAFPLDFPESELLGDIIIDTETATRQKGNKSLRYELQILFIHGLLHLLGYDHIAKRDADLMNLKEKEYRNYIKE